MLNNLDNQSFHCCQSVTYVQVKTLTSQFLQYFNGIVHEGTKINGEKIQEIGIKYESFNSNEKSDIPGTAARERWTKITFGEQTAGV